MILSTLKTILICLEVVVVFNLMIIVHELGHFLAARWRGLVIEKFGIWFGKPIWKKKINGVEYSLGSIPAGGFVALPQLAPMEVLEGAVDTPREQLPPISALDKIIVAFAGPLFSFLLAVFFAVIVWKVGRPVSESESTTTIGIVAPGGPAAEVGLKVGDEILEVDGKPVRRFGGMGEDSITWRIVRSEGTTVPIKVKRKVGDEEQVLTFHPKPSIPETKVWNRKATRQIKIGPSDTPMVAQVEPGSAAAKAGLQPNDLLTEINGQRIYSSLDIFEDAKGAAVEPLTLTVRRGEETMKVAFVPGGAKVGEVEKESPASWAGLKPGDRVIALEGQPVRAPSQIAEFIGKHGTNPLTLTVKRGAEQHEIKVTPQIPLETPDDNKVPRIGILWDTNDLAGITLDRFGKFHPIYPDPWEQIRAGTMSIVNTVGAIISKKSDVKLQHMGGPVMMMRVYYMMFESPEGWKMALWFSVVLNINLALLNLLPIPVLDGGHITLAVVEAARRRPVNVKVLEYVQSACAVLIIGFMLYIFFFDVQELSIFEGKKDGMKFSKPPPAEAK